jgi:hypothetical protein
LEEPRPKRGKRAAALAAVLGTAVLVGGAFALRGAIVEWWWIGKLRSPDAVERNAAAEKLVELGSVRAVPHLVEAVRADKTEDIRSFWVRSYHGGPAHDSVHVRAATPLLLALWSLGEAAIGGLEDALEKEKRGTPDYGSRMERLLGELLDRRSPSLVPIADWPER